MAKANSVTLRIGNDYVLQSRGKTVATIIGDVAFVSQGRYTATTSRYVSQFLRKHASVLTRTVPQSQLDEQGSILEACLMNDKDQREQNLRRFLGKHGPLWIMVTHASRSGMTRRARVFCVFEGSILDITYSVSVVSDLRLKADTCEIVVGGCGFSVQNHIAMALSRSLYHDDYALKYHCL